ncbi:MAG: hypothetical protein OEL79_04735 [Chromatiales bacterium]|nr:hypothetical protein [Chromatiales bacterium]
MDYIFLLWETYGDNAPVLAGYTKDGLGAIAWKEKAASIPDTKRSWEKVAEMDI